MYQKAIVEDSKRESLFTECYYAVNIIHDSSETFLYNEKEASNVLLIRNLI